VVSENNAKTSATIQKRTMIFDSLQPASSKWWCNGDMRKMRLPVKRNEIHLQDHRDTASTTNMPPTEKSRISCLIATAIKPIDAADGQRADVAHEQVGRMRVVPEKGQRGAHQRAAKNGEFADLRQMLDIQIGAEARVAGDVGEHVSAPTAMTTQPMARPSRPSVRLTAFDEPTMTSEANTRKGRNARGQRCGRPTSD
jgi:hypothetical protein